MIIGKLSSDSLYLSLVSGEGQRVYLQLAVPSHPGHTAASATQLVNGGAVAHGVSVQGHRLNGQTQVVTAQGQGHTQALAHLLNPH